MHEYLSDKMGRKSKRAKIIHWSREGTRRLNRLNNPTLKVDDDIYIYDINGTHAQLMKSQLINHPSKKILPASSQCPQSSQLLSLPLEILDMIFVHLSVTDMENLETTCRWLHNLMVSRFRLHLMLPCSDELLKEGKLVLRLTSSNCLKALADPVTGELPFRKMNLKSLKHLHFCGWNYSGDFTVSEEYQNTILYILSKVSSSSLQALEFLHSNAFTVKLSYLLSRFVYLKEVTIHGLRYTGMNRVEESNAALSVFVKRTRAKVLTLQNFSIQDTLYLHSMYLEELKLFLGKDLNISHINMPFLTRLTVGDGFCCECLYHAMSCRLKVLLHKGCPRLRYYNNIDLHNLPRSKNIPQADDPSSAENIAKDGDPTNAEKLGKAEAEAITERSGQGPSSWFDRLEEMGKEFHYYTIRQGSRYACSFYEDNVLKYLDDRGLPAF